MFWPDERKALCPAEWRHKRPTIMPDRPFERATKLMVYCASKERFASSSPDYSEPRALDAALVRCQPNFIGNFSTRRIRALSRWARLTTAAEPVALIKPPTSFTMPAEVTMSLLRFINYGQLRSTENPLHSFGAAT